MMKWTHEQFMQLALDQAYQAQAQGEVPVGAVLVQGGEVIASGYNQPIATCDPTAHAEIVALRGAARALNNYRLVDTTLYVTLEPCIMCMGAIVQARVKTVVYAATDPKAGAVESVFHVASETRLNHQVDCIAGILSAQASTLLKDFFRLRR